MEPINPSSSKLLNDIMAGLRMRYASLNDIPRRPMLNSPTGGTAAGNAFYLEVQRRVAASRESRKAIIKMAHICERRNEPDYAEIVRQINICIAEIRPRLNMSELTQMLVTTPLVEIETLLTRLQKMRHDVQ
jgi:hypothetical protein